jgi:hypothetical protein
VEDERRAQTGAWSAGVVVGEGVREGLGELDREGGLARAAAAAEWWSAIVVIA